MNKLFETFNHLHILICNYLARIQKTLQRAQFSSTNFDDNVNLKIEKYVDVLGRTNLHKWIRDTMHKHVHIYNLFIKLILVLYKMFKYKVSLL